MPAGCGIIPSAHPQTLANELLVLFGDRGVGEETRLFPAPLFELGQAPGFGCLLSFSLLLAFCPVKAERLSGKAFRNCASAGIPPDYRSGCPAP